MENIVAVGLNKSCITAEFKMNHKLGVCVRNLFKGQYSQFNNCSVVNTY